MNIFILDLDFKKNAQYHVDRHIVKMITEQNQILSTVHWQTGGKAHYKPTHIHHPSVKWCMQSLSNYKWLIESTLALCEEYTYRYGKIHAGEQICLELAYNLPNIKDIGLTEFARAMPDNYKNKCIVKSYRDYYNGDKQHLFKWKNRNIPEWVKIKEAI